MAARFIETARSTSNDRSAACVVPQRHEPSIERFAKGREAVRIGEREHPRLGLQRGRKGEREGGEYAHEASALPTTPAHAGETLAEAPRSGEDGARCGLRCSLPASAALTREGGELVSGRLDPGPHDDPSLAASQKFSPTLPSTSANIRRRIFASAAHPPRLRSSPATRFTAVASSSISAAMAWRSAGFMRARSSWMRWSVASDARLVRSRVAFATRLGTEKRTCFRRPCSSMTAVTYSSVAAWVRSWRVGLN